MSEYLTPSIRDSHKYNADWKHLDSWHDADWQYRVLTSTTIDEAGLEESYTQTTIIKTTDNLTIEDVFTAMSGQMSQGCSCEHDCCGHYFGGLSQVISAHHSHKSNKFILTANYSRNY